jgi:DNA-binding Lrp family transcriptional regulator
MKEFRPDDLDFQIIRVLESDCSKTYREIAEETGHDLWMVRDRVVMLKKRGIIGKCKADVNYSGIGLSCRALIMFNVPEKNIDPFISFAKSNPEFKRLFIATGQRRFYLEVVGQNCNGIREYARKTLPQFGIYDVVFEVILDTPL